ncbi:hypothetical protein BDQ17DRAFT_1426694 [Cyathus striatus]|nr:hypothetical protein BDQ17DRAFT_1426694 [Cyathus striatus]
MATRINIPPEIVETIVNEIDHQDFRSLKACTLVCSDISRASRRRLFHSITLGYGYSHRRAFDQYTRLRDVFLSSPELSLYVREFKYIGSSSCENFNHPGFPTMLGMFSNITTFTFDCYVSWPKSTTDLKQALVSIFLLPSLERLELCEIRDMPMVLAKYFIRIPSVTISGRVSFRSHHPDDETMTVSQQPLTKPHGRFLKSFTLREIRDIEDMIPLMDELVPPFCNLEKLMIPFCSSDATAMDVMDIIAPKLITKHKKTLITLELPHIPDLESEITSSQYDVWYIDY